MLDRKFNVASVLFILALTTGAGAIGQVAGAGRYQDSSGAKVSGECANYSEWYVLGTRHIEAGRTIRNFQHELRGDRKCGAWAQCEVITDTPTKKEVRFRMQGHSEYCGLGSIGRPNNGTAQSEMIFTYTVE